MSADNPGTEANVKREIHLRRPRTSPDWRWSGLLGTNSEGGIHFGRPIDVAVFDYGVNVPNVADFFGRITVNQDHVSVFSGCDGTEVAIFMHDRGGLEGCDAKHFCCRNSRFIVDLKLAIESVPASGVGAGDDLDAAVVQLFQHAHHVGVRGAVLLVGGRIGSVESAASGF